jgi:hypothetical protein
MAGRPKKKRASKQRKSSPVVASSPPAATPQVEAKDNAQRSNKIFPRNLTAHATYLVPGNPVVTRPEDAVANCFPGLELDLRNLDRRFFPGLVFEYVFDGARLAYVDAYQDTDLQADTPEARKLYLKLADDDTQKALSTGHWYLDWIEQDGKRLLMHDGGEPFGDTQVWRLVRSLELGPTNIGLKFRGVEEGQKPPDIKTLTLHGWRRQFTDPDTGVISGAYQPGELMQGLCSPWQHDFRDCACFYWAANHPDIVLGELYPGEASLPSASASEANTPAPEPEPELASVPLDWLRVNRTRELAGEALETIEKNRLYQIDHFQINSVWQDLSVVVEGREIGGLYLPQSIDNANPYASPIELANVLRNILGPLEIALTFEYLYAHFSLISEDEAARNSLPMLRGAVKLARDRLLLVAASEMQHLRWVNQMLWGLLQANLIPPQDFVPVLVPATEIPTRMIATSVPQSAPTDAGRATPAQQAQRRLVQSQQRKAAVERFIQIERSVDALRPAAADQPPANAAARAGNLHQLDSTRPATLRPLTQNVVEDFIAVEHPSAYIDGAYARVVATLRDATYPPHMAELALRIVGDGVQHETRFREIRAALSPFFNNPNPIYLRKNFRQGTKTEARSATAPLQVIKESLRSAYVAAADNQFSQSVGKIAKAREAMDQLRQVAENLGDTKQIGIPFFDLWNDLP